MKYIVNITLTILSLISFTKAQSRLFSSQKSLRCTNYGDPHIFPFIGDMQTCGMCGTHTLVKNNWITVTSKIDYVNITSSRATYISKINIAFFDQDGQLIGTFSSDSIERNCYTFNGHIGSGSHIRAYISTTSSAYIYYKQTKINIFIRKNKLGYSFGIYLPESLINDSVGLCVSGCPPDSILTLEQETDPTITSRVSWANNICNSKLTGLSEDPFLTMSRITACIFDLAVTGDESFLAEHLREVRDETILKDENQISKKLSFKKSSLPYFKSYIDDTDEICIPNPCKSKLVNKGYTFRIPYPSNNEYYFECGTDNIVYTKKCPNQTTFNGHWCLEEKI